MRKPSYGTFFGSLALWLIGVVLLVIGIVIGVLLTGSLLDNGIIDNVYKYSAPTEAEECDDIDYNIFYFNLTNPTEVLQGTQLPNYEQVGPYNITRKRCEFDRTQEGDVETYREYFSNATYKPDSVRGDSDRITYFNPGFLGIMKELSKTNPNDPELVLSLNFVGPTLGQVITGLQTPTFTTQVKQGALPTIYLGGKSLAVSQFDAVVRASVSIPTIAGNIASLSSTYGSLGAGNAFFNFDNATNGVANVTGLGTPFSAASINLILYGNPVNGEPAGWFYDTVTFSGYLLFVQQLQNSANYPTIMASYQLTAQDQMLRLAQYAGVFLYSTLPLRVFVTDANIRSQATTFFYTQWSNATLIPTGVDVNGDGSTPDYFEVGTFPNGTIVSARFTATQAVQLWDPTNLYSFTNSTGINYWFSTASPTVAALLQASFGITATQMNYIANWVLFWRDNLAEPYVLSNFGITNINDVAYIQWGSAAVLSGASVYQYNPASFPAAPEFAVFASSNNLGVSFNLTRSKALLANPTTGFMFGNNVVDFVGLVSAGNITAVISIWGLNPLEIQALAGYFQYMAINFGPVAFFTQVVPNNAGPIVTRTALEILFTGQDWLLQQVGEPASVGALFDSDDALSKEEALNKPKLSRKIFNGGSEKELKKSLQIDTYKDSVYLNYSSLVPVSGNQFGEKFGPNVNESETLSVWISLLARAIPLIKTGEFEEKDITLWKFEIDPKFWQSGAENPDVAVYYQTYSGLFNASTYNPFGIFYSRPNWYGVDARIVNTVTGLHPMNDRYLNWFIGVEPRSGVTMFKQITGQLNFEVPKLNRFYPALKSGIYPILWRDDFDVIGEDDAKDFRDTINGAKSASLAILIVAPFLGLVLIAIGTALCASPKGRVLSRHLSADHLVE